MVADYFSYKAYGAIGDDSTDDTAAINTCQAAAVAAGGVIVIDPGTYKITSALNPINLSFASGYIGNRVSVMGYGACSRIRYHGSNFGSPTALWSYQGPAAGVSISTEDYGFVKDFVVECAAGGDGRPPRLSNAVGIKLRNRAFLNVYGTLTRGCGIGLELDGMLSCHFYGISSQQNLRGIYGHNNISLATENANTFYSPIIGNNWQGGVDWNDGGVTFITPNIEGNGLFPPEGVGTGYGIRHTHGIGKASEEINALNIYGGYFENNKGIADVYIRHESPKYTKYNLQNANFRRVSASNIVEHNIKIVHNGTGGLGYSEDACTFAGYNDYATSINRMYREVTGTSLAARDLNTPNNYYQSREETPPFYWNKYLLGLNNIS